MVVSDLHIKYLKRIQISFQHYKHLHSSKQILVHFFGHLLFFFANFCIANYCLHNLTDLNAFIEGFSVFLTGILSTAKAVSFDVKKTSFFVLNKKINEMSLKATGTSRIKLSKINETISKIVKLYYFCVSMTGVYFMILPTYDLLWQVYVVKPNTTIIREVPLFGQVPRVDNSKSPANEIITFLFGIVIFIVVHIVPAVDGMFLIFSLNIKEHFIILQDKFKESSFSNPLRNRKRIQSMIKDHLEALDVAEQLSSSFSLIVFTQTLLTSVQVCVIGYQLVGISNDLMSRFVNIFFLCSILIQLFIYCYGGSLITSESFNVNTAVQQSNWYNLASADRKMLILIMIRAQRPIRIKSGFYEASMESFILILKTAGSYITMIQSIQ